MNAILRPDDLQAGCQVNAAIGTFAWRAGRILSVLRTGLGVFEIGMQQLSILENTFSPSPFVASANPIGLNLEYVSDALVRVRTSSSGDAFDVDFQLDVGRRQNALASDAYVPSPAPPAGGVVNSVTARNGLVNAGTAINVILDVQPADASLVSVPGALSVAYGAVGAIAQIDIGDAASAGASALAARADHQHAFPAPGVAPPAVAAASAEGAATTSARSDHTHQGAKSVTAGAGLANSGTALDPVLDVGAADTSITIAADAISVHLNGDGSIVTSAGVKVGVLASDAQHGNRGNGALHSVADAANAGFMSAADFTKLGKFRTVTSGQTAIGAGATVDIVTATRNANERLIVMIFLVPDVAAVRFSWDNSVSANQQNFFFERTVNANEFKLRAINGDGVNARTYDWLVLAFQP